MNLNALVTSLSVSMLLILQELSHAEVLSRKLRSSEDSGVHADLNTVESETPTLGI